MVNNEFSWYKLDNAAKIYPAVLSEKNSATFRVSVELYDKVDPGILQSALEKTVYRYPTMAVRMRKGLFWYYFDQNQSQPLVHLEEVCPCAAIDPTKNNGYLFKVIYYNRRISLECFHSLTDGSGAVEFIKTLLYQYLLLKGYDIDCENMIKVPDEIPTKYEMEDSFNKYYNYDIIGGRKEEHAEHIEGTHFKDGGLNVIHGVLSASRLNTIAKEKGYTITEFIAAIFIFSIYEENMKYGRYKKPIKISIPVNLRKIFPSKTMRNFSSYVNVAVMIDEEPDFEYVLEEVSIQLREGVKKENLYPRINANVKAEKNIFMRPVPLFLKNVALKQAHNKYGSKLITANVSNLGIISLPEFMKEHVNRFEFVLHSGMPVSVNCGVCSYNDKLVLSLSRVIMESSIVKHFFCYLSNELDLKLDIYSNEWGIRK